MTLKEALIGQGNSVKEAEEIIADMVEQVKKGENPEELLEAEGLEPDYVMDLLEDLL